MALPETILIFGLTARFDESSHVLSVKASESADPEYVGPISLSSGASESAATGGITDRKGSIACSDALCHLESHAV